MPRSPEHRPEFRFFPTWVHVVLIPTGIVAGIAVAIFLMRHLGSRPVGVFAGTLAAHILGRGLADLLTQPDRVRRALILLFLPVAATALLALTWLVSELPWLSVGAGLLGGTAAQRSLARGWLHLGETKTPTGEPVGVRQERWEEPGKPTSARSGPG